MLKQYTKRPINTLLVNGIPYAYLEEGQGPLVMLLHGFPDNALAFDKTLTVLARAGFKVIAPFLRGYYPSGLSPDGDYSVRSIAEDIFRIAEAKGYPNFFLVGHDWGALIAYTMANMEPQKVLKLITLAIPHPRAVKPGLRLFLRARHFITFFFPRYGRWYTQRRNFAYLDYLFRYWAPNWDQPEEHRKMIKESFAKEGYLEAALGYYTSFYRDARKKEALRLMGGKTAVPTLVIAGDADGAIDIEAFRSMDRFFTQTLKLEILAGVGHFPHQEAPETFNEKLLTFLQAR
jgi:pimeloyl-ACP methyl ester carboxylesterase